MGQHHEITETEIRAGIAGSYGIKAEVGRRIERMRRSEDLKIERKRLNDNTITIDQITIRPIGQDTITKTIKRYELEETLELEKDAALAATEANMWRRATDGGDFEAEKFVLDRKGRNNGWGKEDTVNVKGTGIVLHIDKDEDNI